MDNKEFYKKRLKIAKKNIQESPFYTVPSWPVRKIVGLLGSGIAKLASIKVEKPPIARFVEYDKDDKKKIGGRDRLLNYDDVLDGVLQRMSDAKDSLNQGKSKFDANHCKTVGVENEIKNLIHEEISEILNRDNKPENQLLGSHFQDDSNDRVMISNKGIIDYGVKTNNEKTRVANQISYFVQKYLEKKPQNRQFIEKEDLESPNNEPGPLKKYIDDGMKRNELSYIKALAIPLIATIVGVVTLAVASMNPIGLGIGIGLVVLGVVSAISVLVYKNKEMSVDKLTQTIQQEDQDRFKQLNQDVEQEKIRRHEEKVRGKTSTGENPTHNANAIPPIPPLNGVQPHGTISQDLNPQQTHQERLAQQNQQSSQSSSLSS